ncbi:putative transcription factor C2C2-CO-like family [Helianthus annuus]|nr:putative transcription factor C2C2-CO-like family [Helianthus annuus]
MLNEDLTSTLCLKNSTTRARLCDTCHLLPGTIFCEADLAYLCTACDLHVHAANKLSSRHKRVRVCDACEQAPAAFICKADAASLCTTCDAVIHSANPLSRRHHRVPVMPILGSSVYNNNNNNNEPWSVIGLGFQPQDSADQATLDHHNHHHQDEDEAASWLIFHDSPPKNNGQGQSQTNEFVSNGDEYLELVDYNSCQDTPFSDDLKFDDDNKYIQQQQQQQQRYGGCDADSLVPGQKYHQLQHHHHNFQNQKFQLGMDYETSNGGYGYSASLGDSVSMSSMEVGIAVDSTITEASIDLFSNPSIQMPTQLTPIDREARVLRYREKKKTRKFEKTIRYASRKAYAETRPRIQGRFAKRTNLDIDIEVDQMFSTSLITQDGSCTFPSF